MKKQLFTAIFSLLIISGCNKNIDEIKVDNSLLSDKITVSTVEDSSPLKGVYYSKQDFFAYLTSMANMDNMSVEVNFQRLITSADGTYLINEPNLPSGRSVVMATMTVGSIEKEWIGRIDMINNDKRIDAENKYDPKGNIYEANACAIREVGNILKSPQTAKFSNEQYSKVTESLGSYKYKVASYVDAKNSFGTEVRTKYQCRVAYDPVNIACDAECDFE